MGDPTNGETGSYPMAIPKKRVGVDRGSVHSNLEREETAVSACYQGGLPGGGGLTWGLE